MEVQRNTDGDTPSTIRVAKTNALICYREADLHLSLSQMQRAGFLMTRLIKWVQINLSCHDTLLTTFRERAVLSIHPFISYIIWSLGDFFFFHLGFEGRILVLIVPVPGHRLHFLNL